MDHTIDHTNRFTIFPIKYPELWEFYKKAEGLFWTVEEIRLSDDKRHFDQLSDAEKHTIKMILAFFASSDGIVNENISINLHNAIEIPEARAFYTFQLAQETIHNEMYSVLLDTLIPDDEERNKLFNAIETVPAVKRKAQWAMKWLQSSSRGALNVPPHVKDALSTLRLFNTTHDLSALDWFDEQSMDTFLARLLAAFICVEGIFFSSSFCLIFWIKTRGILPGLCTSNEFISRDENLHVEFAIKLFETLGLRSHIQESEMHTMFKEAVEAEKFFVQNCFQGQLLGMNADLMSSYVEYVADRWLTFLGYNGIFGTKNPFPFMELISVGNAKGNFFEVNISSYQKANIGKNETDMALDFGDD